MVSLLELLIYITGLIKVRPGDKVTVNMKLDEFKKEQSNGRVPGGWKDEMKQVLYQLLPTNTAKLQYKNHQM